MRGRQSTQGPTWSRAPMREFGAPPQSPRPWSFGPRPPVEPRPHFVDSSDHPGAAHTSPRVTFCERPALEWKPQLVEHPLVHVARIHPVIASAVEEPAPAVADGAVTVPPVAAHGLDRLGLEVLHRSERHGALELLVEHAHGGPRRVADASEVQVVIRDDDVLAVRGHAGRRRVHAGGRARHQGQRCCGEEPSHADTVASRRHRGKHPTPALAPGAPSGRGTSPPRAARRPRR
jgi:hypothetical protein